MDRSSIVRAGLIIVVGFGLWSCSADTEDTFEAGGAEQAAELAQAPVPNVSAQPDAAARIYAVDAARSEVYWRIYRAGLMPRLGHNHVISVGDFAGSVGVGADPADAEWSLTIPVADLVVDDPTIRARYGEDFSSVPSESDIEGTKRNMLSADVLNAESYGEIRITGQGFTGTLENAMLPVEIEILGRAIPMTLPGTIEIEGDTLTISGEFSLTHEALGMTPFTVLGGAMAVGDEMDFTYRIHAVAGRR